MILGPPGASKMLPTPKVKTNCDGRIACPAISSHQTSWLIQRHALIAEYFQKPFVFCVLCVVHHLTQQDYLVGS